jgi:1-acyl-sn-glycerol-3-phosphate acyltransferase
MVLMSGWIAADALDRDGVAGRIAGTPRVAAAAAAPPNGEAGEGPSSPIGRGPRSDAVVPVLTRHSPRLFRIFRGYVKRFYLSLDFHAVRLSRTGRPATVPDDPLIIVLNHPSWWDPLVGLALTELFPDRTHFVPMEAEALSRYRLFEKLGAFGIEPGTTRGAREFLRTSCAILARPRTALWVTAQGRFADVRERPPGVQPGVAHLNDRARIGDGVVIPLCGIRCQP